MAIDPNIALQYRPPQIESPVQTIATLMQLRNQGSELAFRQAQAAQENQKAMQEAAITEQKNRDLRDEQTLQNAWSDPALGPELAKGNTSVLRGKVQDKYVDLAQTNWDKHVEDQSKQRQEVLKRREAGLKAIGDVLEGYHQTYGDDVAKWNEVLPSAIDSLSQQGILKDVGIDPAQVPKSFGSIDDIKRFETQHAITVNLNAAALSRQKTQGEIENKAAETGKYKAEAEHQTALNKLLSEAGNYDPTAGGVHPVDKVLPASLDPQLNASYKAAFDTAMKQPPDQNGRRPAVDTVLEQAASHAAALSPTLLKNKAATAAAEENARIPGEVRRAVSVAQQTAPIEEARALHTATANRAQVGADKLDAEYNTAKVAADSVGKVLDLAEAGNKAAGANVPLVGVGALNAINGIKRINSAEIHQYGTAGSLLDKIQGKLQGWTEGQPIPKDVLEDMRTLHEQLGAQAYQKYTGGLDALSKRTGVALPPTVAAPAERIQPIKLKDGRVLVPHDKAAADKFRKDHPELIQ